VSTEPVHEPSFSKSFRGFSPKEVAAHLAALHAEMETVHGENEALKLQVAQLEASLRSSRELEEQMRRMLKDMESTSATLLDQSKTNAAQIATLAQQERRWFVKNTKDEAEVIIRDAERRAARILEDADRKHAAMVEEMGMLHSRRMALIARFKSLVTSQLEFLKALERDTKDPTVESFVLPTGKKSKGGIGSDELQYIIKQLEAIEGSAYAAAPTHD
jgi:cell division initiation protein